MCWDELGLGRHDIPHLGLRHRVDVLHVLAQILDGAADLVTARARGHALVDLQVAQQRDAVLVLPETDVALVRIPTCKQTGGKRSAGLADGGTQSSDRTRAMNSLPSPQVDQGRTIGERWRRCRVEVGQRRLVCKFHSVHNGNKRNSKIDISISFHQCRSVTQVPF